MRAGIHGVACTGPGAAECGLRGRHAIGDPEAEARLAHKTPPFCPGSCLGAWTTIADVNRCLLEVLGDQTPSTNPFEGGALPGATAMAAEADGVSGASCSLCSHGTCSYRRDFMSTLSQASHVPTKVQGQTRGGAGETEPLKAPGWGSVKGLVGPRGCSSGRLGRAVFQTEH